MFGSGNGSNNGESAIEGALETVLLEAGPTAAVDRRVAALEMAMTLVCNREEGSSGEDAVGVTRIADVLLEWLQKDQDQDEDSDV